MNENVSFIAMQFMLPLPNCHGCVCSQLISIVIFIIIIILLIITERSAREEGFDFDSERNIETERRVTFQVCACVHMYLCCR